MNRNEIAFTFLISSTRIARNSLSQLLPPLIPILAVALAYPLWQLGLLVTLFTFGSGIGQAPFGYLADKYDRRYILPTGFVVAGASYLVFALAPRIGALVPDVSIGALDAPFLVMALSMFFVGIGTSVVHPTAYPMISENIRESNKGKVLGIFGSAAKIGGAIIPLVVGLLILFLVWEGIVAVIGVFGVVYGTALFLVLGRFETRPMQAEPDDTAEPTDAEERDEPNGHENPGGRDDPDDPDGQDDAVLELSGDRREYVYPLVVIYVFFITRAFAGKGLRTFIPAFIVGVYGYTFQLMGTGFTAESVANFYLSALLFIGAGTQIVLGWIVDRYDARKALILFMLTATGGILVLAYLPLTPLPLLIVLFVVGAGIWGLNPARDMLISNITPADREGRTFGYLWTASSLTSALIPTAVGYIADSFGLRHSFGVLAVGTLLAAGSILFLYSQRVYVEPDTTTAPQ